MATPTYLSLPELATYVRKARKEQGLTQKEVADRLGIGHTQVSEIERLGPHFSLETARKIIIEVAGTTIDRKRIQVPIRAATDEEKARVESASRNIKEGEKLPPVRTRDLEDVR
jgi:transcriptional regulator with XRE-family HTH domain